MFEALGTPELRASGAFSCEGPTQGYGENTRNSAIGFYTEEGINMNFGRFVYDIAKTASWVGSGGRFFAALCLMQFGVPNMTSSCRPVASLLGPVMNPGCTFPSTSPNGTDGSSDTLE